MVTILPGAAEAEPRPPARGATTYDAGMAALAYAILPVSGLVAYLLGSNRRIRFHGLQAIVLGLVWGAALYAASAVAATATQVVFAAGAAVWLLFVFLTAIGRDPRLPLAGRPLEEIAEADPRAR